MTIFGVHFHCQNFVEDNYYDFSQINIKLD